MILNRIQGPRVQHFDMVIAAAQAGLGVGLIPEIFAQQAIASGNLHKIQPQSVRGPTPYVLIRPSIRPQNTTMDAFAHWLRITTCEHASEISVG